MRTNHEIDYFIHGEEMQMVEIELDPNETAIAEAGAFMYMDEGIQMETIFGDGSQQQQGFMSKIWSAGKRLLTGESLFMTAFTHTGIGKARVAFASPYPGKIIAIDLIQYGGKLICQKDSFLCAAKGVAVGIEFQKKLGTGLFGGEVSLDAADRMGDVIAIAHGEMILIEAEREKQEGAMVGHHGGATDIESFVPLLTHVTS